MVRCFCPFVAVLLKANFLSSRSATVQCSRMAAFFSAPVLTFVVFAGVAAVSWIRNRPNPLTGSQNSKKQDDESIASTTIEVVVDKSLGAATNCLPLDKRQEDATNRRQHTKTTCDRFEARHTNTEINNAPHDNGDSLPAQFAALKNAATTAICNNANSAKLSSFVRQCVSNIERANNSFGGVPVRSFSPRASLLSNQCDSPPKASAIGHLPSLVTATDCDPTTPGEDVDGQDHSEEAESSKPVFRRMPSISTSKPPMLAPFIASKSPRREKDSLANPEQDVDAGLETKPPAPRKSDSQQTAPLVRKGSASERLQQFQQLVPSNQARISQVQ